MALTNDLGQGLTGLPAANSGFTIAQLSPGINGGSSKWQSYPTRASGGIADAQATTESGSASTFTDNGDGTYQYTFAMALTDYPAGPVFDQNKTHRVGIEIRTNRGGFLPENLPANNAPFDFVPAGGAPLFTRLIVDNDTCNACHDKLDIDLHVRYESFSTKDWAISGVNPDTVPTVLALGANPYDYDVWVFGIGFRYLVGERDLSFPE